MQARRGKPMAAVPRSCSRVVVLSIANLRLRLWPRPGTERSLFANCKPILAGSPSCAKPAFPQGYKMGQGNKYWTLYRFREAIEDYRSQLLTKERLGQFYQRPEPGKVERLPAISKELSLAACLPLLLAFGVFAPCQHGPKMPGMNSLSPIQVKVQV